jgi:hypothetical protein
MSRPASILPWCGITGANGFVTASFLSGTTVVQSATVGTPPTQGGSPPATQGGSPSAALNANPACLDFTAALPGPSAVSNGLGDEFVGPFASWSNLKRDFGAVGDGVADDTKAVQAALTALSQSGHSPVLFVPAGTYRVTSTVTLMSGQSLSVIGEDPGNTVFKWAGASGGILLHIDGVAYSRFDRLTFDGAGTAGVLIDQSLTGYNQGQYFDTGNEYADDVFKNAGIGIQGGQYGLGAAESSVLRSKFLNHSFAGISLKNFNALDWFVWYSDFENNQYGITNNPGAGNFHAFNSVFIGSTKADLELMNTGNFNFRGNYSLNSNKFLNEEYFYSNAAVTRLEGNTVVTPSNNDCNGCAVMQGNMGPTIMTDNVFVSPAGASWPTVIIHSLTPPDCVSVGNTFTSNNPLACESWQDSVKGRLVDLDNKVGASVSVPPTPVLPGVLPNNKRQVFEVATGSGATAIQQAINQAAGSCGQRPVVHLPFGMYSISQTITLPANCDVQLVGDGGHTVLTWSGGAGGPVIALQGPSRAILRDLYVSAGSAVGIDIRNADQEGSRVYMQQPQVLRSSTANVFVDGLDYTNVELHNFNLAYTAVAPASSGVGLKVTGGPLAAQGTPKYGRTSLFAGSLGANHISYQATQGASLVVKDAWYEGNNQSVYASVSDNSNFTVDGSRIALPSNNGDAFQLNNHSCMATVAASSPDSNVAITGGAGNVWVVGTNFGTASSYLTQSGGSTQASFNLNRKYAADGSSIVIPDMASVPGPSFVRALLAQSRSSRPSLIADLATGITDVRLYRVSVELGTVGIHIGR